MTDDNEWEDVLGNGDLMRKVVRKGNGERPTAGQLVKISSKPIHAEESERKELQLILGHGFFIDAFDLTIRLMEKGEVTLIRAHPRFVGPNADRDSYEFEIELLGIQPADTIDARVRIEDAREYGNQRYNNGEYEKAVRLYDYGASLISEIETDLFEEDVLNHWKYTLTSNKAACLIKLEDWQKVVEITEDLELDESVNKLIMVKLLLRRSEALTKLRRYVQAQETLQSCMFVDPSNTAAKSMLERVKSLNKKDEKKMKNVYRNMMKALGTDESNKKSFVQRVLSKKFLLLTFSILVIGLLIHLFQTYYRQ